MACCRMRPLSFSIAEKSRRGGSSIGSSLRQKVPQWMGRSLRAPTSWNTRAASSGPMCCGDMNQRGAYAPMGKSA